MHSSRFSELAGCEVSHGCFQHHHHHWLRHHRRHHHRYAVHKLFQSDPILRIPREVCSVSTWLPSSSSFFKRRLMFAFIVLQITMVSRSPKMILPRRWRQSFLTGFLVYRPTGLHLVSPLVRQCFLQSTNVVRCFFRDDEDAFAILQLWQCWFRRWYESRCFYQSPRVCQCIFVCAIFSREF